MKHNVKKLFSFFAPALLAAAIILAEFGLVRSLRLGSLLYICLHAGVIFLLGICLFALLALRTSLPKSKKVLLVVLGSLLFFFLWLLLIGYRQHVAGICCSGIVVCAVALFSAGIKNIKWKGLLCGGLSLLLVTSVCLSCYLPNKIASEKRLRQTPIADHSAGFAHAQQPKTIYFYPFSEYSTTDGIILKSLQGYLGLTSDTQIFIAWMDKELSDHYYSIPLYFQTIDKYYPDVTITEVENVDELLENVGPLIQNYIYCDEDDPESCAVAFNLCHQFRSVVVSKSLLPYAEKYGWKKVFDTTNKDQKWLIGSEYFSSLDKSFVFINSSPSFFGSYADYAIVSGSWLIPAPRSVRDLEKYLPYFDRNFILVGGLNGLEERAVVSATSRYSGTFVFSGGMANVAALSGFRLENAVKNEVNTDAGIKKQTTPIRSSGKNKHTVCIMLSDGDNMRFTSGSALSSPRFLGSKTRTGENNLTYGMSGMAALLMPFILLTHYDTMYPTEDYVMQLGSVGYVLPSYWNDDEAFKKVTDLLVQSMETADTRVVEIMDDISFLDATDKITDFGSLRPIFDKYTCYDRIDGCLFINFMDLYAGFGGKICWSNGKPIVSARYSLWNDIDSDLASEKNSIEYIANSINHASTDETSEDSYSFVIVHAWSGLDKNGNFVPRGDAVAAMNKLVSLLDEDVEVVSAEEFINRIKSNVKK